MESTAQGFVKSTVHDYLELWNWDGTLERVHHALHVAVREQAGREASPTAAIIDSQSAKGAQKGVLARSFGPRRGQECASKARVTYGGRFSSRQLSIDLEADERFGWVTGRAEAS